MERERETVRELRAGLAVRVAELPHLVSVRRALRREAVAEAWLVGGAVRDLAAGRERAGADLDLALPGSGRRVALRLARYLEAAAFPLDEAQGAWRVVRSDGHTVDCIPLRAATLDEDLKRRDFTVNAIAFDLVGEAGLVDPLDGLGDLARGVLRLCGPASLADDPVRVLRAYRFSAALDLGLAEDTVASLGRAAPRIWEMSPERVRTEWFGVLGLDGGERSLRVMACHGVLEALFPFVSAWRGFDQGDYHAYDLLEHSLRTAEAAGGLASAPGALGSSALGEHLERELEGGISRRSLLVCAALFHDIAKPGTVSTEGSRRRFLSHEVEGGRALGELLGRLRVSRRTQRAARRLVAAHLRLFQLAHQDPPTRRARLRYLQDLGEEVPEAVLLSLADERATGPRPPCLEAIRRTGAEVLDLHWQRRSRGTEPPLLRGRDLLEELAMPEGPQVGEVLRQVAEAEARGEVATRAQALALARRLAQGEV